MRRRIPNLLIVGGDGRNSGKTAMVCRILTQMKSLSVVPVKISPHFHEPSPGLEIIEEQDGFRVYRETNLWNAKDTSRMLQCGAVQVFYSQSEESKIAGAFEVIFKLLPAGTPVVCESPALVKYIEPGIFVLMRGSDKPSKDLSEIEIYPHSEFTIDDIDGNRALPFVFENLEWKKG
jgi:hypothetical protein